jgi:hypothetical protein
MALSTTDKDCLNELHNYLVKRERLGKLTDDEVTHFTSLKTGGEAERVAAAKWYAESVMLPMIQGHLDIIDQQKADLQSKKATLETYI